MARMDAQGLLGRSVSEVLQRWPWTHGVFRSHGMICPGCAMAGLATVEEAAFHYALDPLAFAAELATAIADLQTT